MKIAGIMPIGGHPKQEDCLAAMMSRCDIVCVRADTMRCGDLSSMIYTDVDILDLHTDKWDRGDYHEKMLRMLDDVKPDIVIALDHDEEFEDGIDEEIRDFWASDKKGMMFTYRRPLPTEDGHDPLPGHVYPSLPHMKVYKWKQGLSYTPYAGCDQVTQYANDVHKLWMANTKILHYCMWNKELEEAKKEWVMKEYGIF